MMLGILCDALGVEFSDSMLSWPAGLRSTDGVWAKHWYKEVETSTGFRPYRSRVERVPDRLVEVYRRCLEDYERLYEHRMH